MILTNELTNEASLLSLKPRDKNNTEAYAFEELVDELGAAYFLFADMSVSSNEICSHVYMFGNYHQFVLN